MAKKKKKKKQSLVNWRFVIIASLILSVAAIITMADYLSLPSFIPTWDEVGDTLDDITQNIADNYDIPELKNDKELKVHYIDVGQGDSILIQYDGKNALIDSGDTGAANEVIGYLNATAVSRIDVLIISHPDSDHIGSMSKIIDNYDIGAVYMPPLSVDLVPTTNVYINMLTSIAQKGLKIELKEAGDTIKFGDLKFNCVAPQGDFASLNNSSIAFKLTFGETSFLFTGDMEKASEKSTMIKHYDVSADVLKVAHHGGDSSTIEAFLEAVSPKIAVISVGEGNKYGHPDLSVLEALIEKGVDIYRTDLEGDIVIVSDGKQLEVITQK